LRVFPISAMKLLGLAELGAELERLLGIGADAVECRS